MSENEAFGIKNLSQHMKCQNRVHQTYLFFLDFLRSFDYMRQDLALFG